MSTRQRVRPVTVEHLKEVCEREQSIALEKKQRALEKHQRREEKMRVLEAQRIAQAEALQQSRKEKVLSDAPRDCASSLVAESRLEEVQRLGACFVIGLCEKLILLGGMRFPRRFKKN
jgi:hypothetical protein